MFDVATRWGVEKQSGDFGQTLAHYGVPEMLYLVLPILGPSNPRDVVGMVADGYADPFSYLADDYGADVATYSRWGAEGIDQRDQNLSNLDELQRNAIDLYAEIRSLYRQHRAAELRHGEAAPTSDEMDELYRDPGAPSAARADAKRSGTALKRAFNDLKRSAADLAALLFSAVAGRQRLGLFLEDGDQAARALLAQDAAEFRAPRRQLADRAAEKDVDDAPLVLFLAQQIVELNRLAIRLDELGFDDDVIARRRRGFRIDLEILA